MQGTVGDFDMQTGAGVVLLDDGSRLEFAGNAFAASGLRLLRVGQRVQIYQNSDGEVSRITIPTMRQQL